MGASYYAHVIVGFPVSKREKKKQTKRFNEVTGEPYLKDEFDFTQAVIGKHAFSQEESDAIFEDGKLEGLKLRYTTDQNDFILGVVLASTEDINYQQSPINFPMVVPKEVSKFAEKYELTPEFFLVPYCSY